MGAIWGGYTIGNGGIYAILPRDASRECIPPAGGAMGLGAAVDPWAQGPMAPPGRTGGLSVLNSPGPHGTQGRGIDKLSIPGAQAPMAPPLTYFI